MDFKQSLVGLGKKLHQSLIHLVYPAKCLHCQALLPPGPLVLCSSCPSLLELISPKERCPACFNARPEKENGPCQECAQYPSHFLGMAAAFDYEGPAASLVKHFKYANKPYLARGMAAFLVAQFDQVQWPMPDAIVPVPLSFTHWLDRGYNQSALLAEELGRFLDRPVWKVLKRLSGDYSQAALNLEQRKALEGKRFKKNAKYALEGKIILVIDDVMTSGLTLQRCGEVLGEAHPAALYALTFCRTLKS